MLDYDLGARGEKTLYEFLYQRIRDDITEGALGAGDRLPSKRSLAQHLGISVITVEAAYQQLVAEGYVASRPRSGFYVNALPTVATPTRRVDVAAPCPASEPETNRSFMPSVARIWSRELRSALAQESESELFSPTSAQGSLRLRRAIANHLRQTRGMEVDPACVVVGAGAQTLDNAIVQLLGHDLTYAVEDPGYLRLTHLYQANGVEVKHVGMDEQGVRPDELLDSGADVLHLMPSHQFPTGRVTSVARRYELLSWASAMNSAGERWLVEDDYDCEFRLAGRPVPALASIDAAGRVIYTNTFTKSLGGALRLAYMVLPGQLMERYGSELSFYSPTVGSVEQLTLARLLESGAYERHVARIRKRSREERDLLIGALRSSSVADRIRVEEEDSGLHFVLAIETARGESEVADAPSDDVRVLSPLSQFAWEPKNGVSADGLKRFVVQYEGRTEQQIDAFVCALEKAVV